MSTPVTAATPEPSNFDPAAVARYFDEYGVREWERLVQTPVDEVSLHLHAHYLAQHIAGGSQVLEIGAGAGRFTQILAGLGAQVLVADLSPGQLALNRQFALEHGFAQAVTAWQQADICDLSCFGPDAFALWSPMAGRSATWWTSGMWPSRSACGSCGQVACSC